ncbi:MAG: cytochrome c/FTR1 family iron permease [Bdellovibrionales bacterium]
MKNLILILFTFLFVSINAKAQEASPDLIVHLLDYLAKDYAGAVQDGKILSQGEYDEQVEFITIVATNSQKIEDLKKDQKFSSGVQALQSMILNKKSADEVSKLARSLQLDAIRITRIEISPRALPDIKLGEKLFQVNCTSCHGNTGHGDGLAGVSLDPKPANFHDPDLVSNSSPYKFYNTIKLGVPGTGMVSFAHLSDEEVWALAFYLKSMGYADKSYSDAPKAALSLKDISTLTDTEIADRLGGKTDKTLAVIGRIRTILEDGNINPLDIAKNLLRESALAVKNNEYNAASSLAIRAYLEGIEPLEPKMKANLPGSVEKIESLMSGFRSLVEKKETFGVVESKKDEIVKYIDELQGLFATKKMSPEVAFGAAFSIFLREGFEAVLIIIILISILRTMSETKAIRWVHFGWMSAVGAGIAAWIGSGFLLSMSGLSRELLEGVISLFAVAVLIYVGFWLHRYSEMKKWREFLELKLKHGLNTGSYFVLAIVAFMAVFREAFEVVLFLRAIWLDLDSSGEFVASMGVVSSTALLLVFSYFAIKESKKLPLKQLFTICSWTMVALAIILVGKGVHSLQEAGFVGVSEIPLNLRLDILGIYPSIQSLISQALVVLLFSYLFWNDRKIVKQET